MTKKGGKFKSGIKDVVLTDLGEGEEEPDAAGSGESDPDLALDLLLAKVTFRCERLKAKVLIEKGKSRRNF
jgi:hypothetical protein